MAFRCGTIRGASVYPVVGALLLSLGACGPSSDPIGPGGPARDAAADAPQRDANPWPGDYDALPASDGGEQGQDATCALASTKAEQQPLDIYIMLDQSGSMGDAVSGGTKWSAVTSALAAFVNQPGLTGISVGLQYFPLPVGGVACTANFCNTTADCGGPSCGPCLLHVCLGAGSANDSCTAADYAHPDVEIAPVPGVNAALTTSVVHHGPTNSTPTSAALQGGIDHARTWASAHPGHVAILVLATDGDPTECDTDLGHIDAIATAGASGTPKILTFVIGVGASLSNLNGIAAAGGTTQAFMVDTGGNVTQQFLAALNAIRGQALGCTYQIPPPGDGGAPDYGKVNVQYTPGSGGGAELVPQVADQAHCPASGDAWYYDNPTAPTQIILCAATCSTVMPDTSGEVDVLIGCKTQVID
ncbi:MAG TPA: hypothetical protein VGQ83_02600 [Polyangia bacterium]|jgi:hypothetical protein